MVPKYAGIDVSAWQGEIDFNAVKKGKLKDIPISFVMIRISVDKSVDTNAVKNITEALRAGLQVGVYHYSYAKTAAEAKAEAEFVLKTIKGNGFDGKISLPVVFDIEESDVLKLGKDTCTAIAKGFMDTIAKAGYQPMLYTYAAAYKNYFNKNALKGYPLWIAGYISEAALNGKFGVNNYDMWQFGIAGDANNDTKGIGGVAGVNGNCDCDYMYTDLAKEIKAEGKNGFAAKAPAKPSGKPDKGKKSVETLAQEVINGQWGNGKERVEKLTAAGYSYAEVQKRVNEILYPPKKSIAEVAAEVVRGDWGNGDERFRSLTEAGYDAAEVQRVVNQMIYGDK